MEYKQEGFTNKFVMKLNKAERSAFLKELSVFENFVFLDKFLKEYAGVGETMFSPEGMQMAFVSGRQDIYFTLKQLAKTKITEE